MKVLITGAGGFVGKNLQQHLAERKDVEVVCFTRANTVARSPGTLKPSARVVGAAPGSEERVTEPLALVARLRSASAASNAGGNSSGRLSSSIAYASFLRNQLQPEAPMTATDIAITIAIFAAWDRATRWFGRIDDMDTPRENGAGGGPECSGLQLARRGQPVRALRVAVDASAADAARSIPAIRRVAISASAAWAGDNPVNGRRRP